MRPEEIENAAFADPEARPLTSDDFRRMKRTPQVKIIRRPLSLTQEEFAERYESDIERKQSSHQSAGWGTGRA